MKKLLPLTLIIFFALCALARAASHDKSFKFTTIETEHFSIHYHQGLEDVAKKAAAIAEAAHERLSAELRWEPREKTQIILIDDSDFANGYATGYATVPPYNFQQG